MDSSGNQRAADLQRQREGQHVASHCLRSFGAEDFVLAMTQRDSAVPCCSSCDCIRLRIRCSAEREEQHPPAASQLLSPVHATMRPLPPVFGGAQTMDPHRGEGGHCLVCQSDAELHDSVLRKLSRGARMV